MKIQNRTALTLTLTVTLTITLLNCSIYVHFVDIRSTPPSTLRETVK